MAMRVLSVAFMLAVATASAGVFTEIGDAGALPGTAQWTFGVGSLTAITGSLGASDADMYAIWITGGSTFSATTEGGPSLDSQLFLFSSSGMGVYANDDGPFFHAVLPAGHALTPNASGIYYLVISTWDLDPVSAGGLIFPSFPFNDVFGSTGPGGGSPISGYTGSSFEAGSYTVTLTGAEFAAIPEPVSSLLVGCGLTGLGLFYRRRR